MRFGTNMALCYLRKYFFPPYTTPRMAREQILDHIPSCNKHPPQTKENKYSFIWECREPVESMGLRNFLSVTKNSYTNLVYKCATFLISLALNISYLPCHKNLILDILVYIFFLFIFWYCKDIMNLVLSDKSIFSLLLGWNKSQSMPCL